MRRESRPFSLGKQGVFYQIPLGKENGPFLSKDIMHNNPKSISLLTGTEILKSHTSMVNTLKFFDNQGSTKTTIGNSSTQVENFNISYKYLDGELLIAKKTSA